MEEAREGLWRDGSEAEPRRAGCSASSFSERSVVCVDGYVHEGEGLMRRL